MRTVARRVVLLPDRWQTDTAAAGFSRSDPSAASPSRTADQRVCHEAVRRALAMRADCVQSVISYCRPNAPHVRLSMFHTRPNLIGEYGCGRFSRAAARRPNASLRPGPEEGGAFSCG